MLIAWRRRCAYRTEIHVKEMAMRTIGLALLCALAAGACGSANAGLGDRDRDAIRTATQKYVESDDKRDTDGMMQLIAESAVYMPANSQPIVGREAIRALFKLHPWDKIVETPAEIEGRLDFAIVRGAYTSSVQGKPFAGYYIEVWQKQPDGAWRITRKVWNTDRQ
jgi:ketosteroid isomerase-like protein